MKKQVKKEYMRVSDAIAQGYTRYMEADGGVVLDLSDVREGDGEMIMQRKYYLCEKTPMAVTIDTETLRSIISDHLANIDEVNDESGQLCEAVDEMPLTDFEPVVSAVNAALNHLDWWTQTNIRLLP